MFGFGSGLLSLLNGSGAAPTGASPFANALGTAQPPVQQPPMSMPQPTPQPILASGPSWQAIQNGIFKGESGGDYDTLFGHSQRPGQPFAGTKLTNMTVGQAAKFADPSGPYGQWVNQKIGRVATPLGAYQIVGSTLKDALKAGVVKPDDPFDMATQDKLGKWILKTQGTSAWSGYKGPSAKGPSPSASGVVGQPGKIGGDSMVARNTDAQTGPAQFQSGSPGFSDMLVAGGPGATDTGSQPDTSLRQRLRKALGAVQPAQPTQAEPSQPAQRRSIPMPSVEGLATPQAHQFLRSVSPVAMVQLAKKLNGLG